MPTTVMWFRRDLRLSDNPALAAAVQEASADGAVVALFCLDPQLLSVSGPARIAYLLRTLRALDGQIGGSLVVRSGDPATEVPRLAVEVGASTVHAAGDFAPYGRSRDEAVGRALAEHSVGLEFSGSPYAVEPGLVTRPTGEPYKVFGAYNRGWTELGWAPPISAPRTISWMTGAASVALPDEPACEADLPQAGEIAAKAIARQFWDRQLEQYDKQRNFPGVDATSRLSPHLKFGTIHPRQLLAKLDDSPAHDRFRKEVCWRDFYADVLYGRPDSARLSLDERMRSMQVDEGPTTDERFRAWVEGRTGYPLVDAGMRQLVAEGWMHNRVRMVVASFFVKDLHLDWGRGARYFMNKLVDGDLASNSHGWQWTAGTGTDAAPYFRVFNPVAQGERFDPSGDYVRRWIPELRGISGGAVHKPWAQPNGVPTGYPNPIVDHAEERVEALRRYSEMRGN